jgi:hypothetical protein
MDAKEVLEQTKKHHFWILCVVVLITGVVGWYMAVNDLSAKTTQQISAIGTSYTQASGVAGSQKHPNPSISIEVDKLLDKKKEDVYWGWAAQYQKQQDLVVWPDIDPTFNAQAKKIEYPFEQYDNTKELFTAGARGNYKNYSAKHLSKLADIIKSNWSYSDTLADATKGDVDARAGQAQLVYWEPGDQARLMKIHFEPVTKETPTALKIVYAQEDFWVLSELLKIIARTNEKTAGGVESTIRTLDSIALGRTAIADPAFTFATVGPLPAPVSTVSTKTNRPTGGGAMMGGPMGMQGMGGGSQMPGMSGPTGTMGGGMPGAGGSQMPGMSGPTGTMGNMPTPGGSTPSGAASTAAATGISVPAETNDPADNRYVDSNFKPLAATVVRGARKTIPTNAEQAAMAVAKRIPVRIRVRMDQRHVADLLAECANGKLPVEVRQWRINPQGQQTGGQKSTGGKGRRGANPNLGGMPMVSNEGSDRDATDSDDMEVLFEMYGLVYLYNPANPEQLGLPKAPEKRSAPTAATPVVGNQPT